MHRFQFVPFLILISCFLLLVTSPVFAQETPLPESTSGSSLNLHDVYQPVVGKGSFQTIGGFVGLLYRVILFLGGIVAFFLLLLGGIRYIISGGDEKKTQEARGMLTAAVIGFGLLVVAAILYPIVQNFLGLPTLF